jgi:hypothetical protein
MANLMPLLIVTVRFYMLLIGALEDTLFCPCLSFLLLLFYHCVQIKDRPRFQSLLFKKS